MLSPSPHRTPSYLCHLATAIVIAVAVGGSPAVAEQQVAATAKPGTGTRQTASAATATGMSWKGAWMHVFNMDDSSGCRAIGGIMEGSPFNRRCNVEASGWLAENPGSAVAVFCGPRAPVMALMTRGQLASPVGLDGKSVQIVWRSDTATHSYDADDAKHCNPW